MTSVLTFFRASPALTQLLEAELRFSPVVERHYSSHLPMALVALERLGADAARLHRYFDDDTESEPREDAEVLAERRREIAEDGVAATLRRRLPDLVRGPGSQLFHPLIRLAYALDADHAGQVAAALLDWERRLVLLPFPDGRGGPLRLAEVAEANATRSTGTWRRTADLAATARRPEVQEGLACLAAEAHSLEEISMFARDLHAGADDFITLHLVTAARAARTLSPWLEEETARALVGHLAQAMAITHAALGAPVLPTSRELDAKRRLALPEPSEIAAQALISNDPHVVKLADVALLEAARTGDPLDRYLAARGVGMLAR